MNIKQLLLKLLPGLLPLFVFIIADEIWGTRIGLIVAIGVGVFEMVFLWIKEQRFDKFILFDTALIVALGGISILLDNDVFFKVKPAIIGVIICILLGVSVFTPKNFVMSMSKRYLKGIEFTDEQQRQMRSSLKIIFFIFLFHTALVFYSVWFLSKEAWAFISGGLFYILIGGYFASDYAFKFIKNRKYKNEEWLPLVNREGKIIGKATRTECHKDKNLLHPVVHLHVFNAKGDLYLQKRPMHKLVQPGKWDTAVGGHISFNETVEQSLERESFEEIGISAFTPQLLFKYEWKSDIESELVFCFVTTYTKEIKPNKTELDGGKFWTLTEIKKQLEKGLFTPNFEHEFKLLGKVLKKYPL
jgi:isopentenyldiphosphate isomerase/intracellular septation protein A